MTANLQSHKTLTVYKASAGSGKTFRLAVEYIKLLIQNPKAYDGILAVTFTNKATEEMKMRILSQLYGLWKKLPGSRAYLNEISSCLQMSEEAISQRAETALHLLLHNYHFFRVQTIDTFFQAVLRNLAKELQLNANLKVELNTAEVVGMAVDEIIDSLSEDKALMGIVMGYVEERLSEDKSWNVIGPIKDFGKNIFKEIYKKNREKMNEAFANPSFFDDYKKKLYAIKKNTEKKYRDYGLSAVNKIEEAGLSINSFSSGSRGPVNYFYKLAKGELKDDQLLKKKLIDGMNDSKPWVKKKIPEEATVRELVETYLMPLVNRIEETRSSDVCLHYTAIKTLDHINEVRLLRKIEETAHSLNDAAQRFMLDDTQSLLHEITEEGDTSFIFEKIGSRLEHVMIDEFQDTSTIQWANFKPLLHECMSQGFSNLIVGDVKQSIYRFRSGDWRLLNDIDKEFSAEELEFPPINTNWRSDANIIHFNNTFFKTIAAIEVDNIKEYSEEKALSVEKAYADVEQMIPDGREATGLVHIEMLPKDDLDNEMKRRTLQTIIDLMEHGAQQKDIAILTRRGREINALAQFIEQESDGNIKIISAEAFTLQASAAVRIIVNAMIVMAHPQEDIALASLITDYYKVILRDDSTLAEAMARHQDLCTLLPEEFVTKKQELLAMSLHDMAENIIRIFSINTHSQEAAYITFFFDQLHDFTNDMAPVLEDFINAWDVSLSSKTIQSTESDGVRILTIHKSKGLEFKHVILPYCNWTNNDLYHPSTLWVEPKQEPFSELPVVPIEYTDANGLANTLYRDYGYDEYIQNVVDDLNLLYVAMTRAGSSLFMFGERSDKPTNRSTDICATISQLPDNINGIPLHIDGIDNKEEVLSLTYGILNTSKKEGKVEASRNVFTPNIQVCETSMCSFPNNAEFLQSSESRRFAQDEMEESDRQRMIRMGTVLHQLFASIRTTADIEPALQRMEFDGTLYGDGITREVLLQSLKKKLSNPTVNNWFSDKWEVYNECCIISPDGSEHRPDRVIRNNDETIVIDFKFGKKNESHKRQVKEYMSLLEQMGMKNIKGYLWYVSSSSIVAV